MKINFWFVSIALASSNVFAFEGSDSDVIFHFKKGHKKSCVPTITRQLVATGFQMPKEKVELYCECLGNYYFNEMSKKEITEMNSGKTPHRIIEQRRDISEYCADLHFK